MPTYHQMSDSSTMTLSINHVRAIYITTFLSSLIFLILLILAIELVPVIKDAGILINDASLTLNDFSIMIPEINGLIPEAKNTTRILGHMIPEINQGMRILAQLCLESPKCSF